MVELLAGVILLWIAVTFLLGLGAAITSSFSSGSPWKVSEWEREATRKKREEERKEFEEMMEGKFGKGWK